MPEIFKGTYDDRAIYKRSDIVEHQNNLYCCIRTQVDGCQPPDRDIWKLVGKVSEGAQTYFNPRSDPRNCHWSLLGSTGETGHHE
jgi:hypothetical protein